LRDQEIGAFRDVVIVGGDRNVVVLAVLQHRGERRVGMGRKHDGVDASRSQVLNVGDLLVGVFSSIEDDKLLDQSGCLLA
jgi:hypothetical protein